MGVMQLRWRVMCSKSWVGVLGKHRVLRDSGGGGGDENGLEQCGLETLRG